MTDTSTTSDGGDAVDATDDVRTDGGHASALPEGEADHDEGHLPPKSSIKRWLVTTNHKDIGVLYTVTALFFLLAGGMLALMFRVELWTPGSDFLSASAYNQSVSAHGLLMVFWFLSPFAFGFANYVVPLQIGAKDLAFPRLNALSYWLYLSSGLVFLSSFFVGGTFAGGWTMYAPLNTPAFTPSVGASTTILALMLFVASVTVSSVNFLVSMHRMRAEGLTYRNLPLFTWTIVLTVWMMLFAFAALLAALIVLSSDRLLGTTYFASQEGGSLLWTHLFWFFGHPEVYIVFFPALGVMAECFQTFTGQRIVGRKWFIGAMVLVALQSFLVWMHHMFLTSINLNIKTLFMATTIGISLPFDLMVFALIYTLIKGRIRFKTPFLFSLGALAVFIVGGITGVFLGAVVLDYEFRGTYWVVAHFHYVMVGGVTALVGGLYYWFPKMSGKMYDEYLGKVHFALYFVGFNLLYFPMFFAWETPRRVFEYAPAFVTWHRVATVGGFILGTSFLLMFYNFTKSLVAGEDADDNPWAYSTTAEWAIESPPPIDNFPGIPSYASGALEFLKPDAVTQTPAAELTEGTPTTDGGVASAGDAVASEDEHVDHASVWPLVVGVASFFVMIGAAGAQQGEYVGGTAGLVHAVSLGLGLGILAVGLVGMARESFTGLSGPFGESWPFENVENTKLGMWIFLASDVVLFGAFIGSYVFIRVAEGWRDWHHLIPEAHVPLPGLINTYLLLTSSFAVVLALVAAERNSRKGVVASLGMTLLLGLGFLVNKGLEWNHLMHVHSEAFANGWWISTNIASSTFYLTTGLHGAHVIVGLLITLYMIPRAWNGAYLDDETPIEYFGLYWHFVDIVWLFLFPLFYIL